jgi:YfiH family protein
LKRVAPAHRAAGNPLAETVVTGSAIPRLRLADWEDEFGVVAGLTWRGPTDPPFDLRLAGTDPRGAVADRWRLLQRDFPDFHAVVVGRQVHGTEIRWHESAPGLAILSGVDGHGTSQPGVLLTVTLADCIPVYLLDRGSGAVLLLHAGWRGVAAGILEKGIRLLQERAGARVENVLIHCGVGICGSCYEVGLEVFRGCGMPIPAGGKGRLDLRSVLRDQAMGLGLSRVSTSPHCSAHQRSMFFSHRGSGGTDGRMAAFLGIRPGAARSN